MIELDTFAEVMMLASVGVMIAVALCIRSRLTCKVWRARFLYAVLGLIVAWILDHL